jgi:hypothetical protein
MSDNKIFTFNDGMPTKPDVDLLLRTWPKPDVGDEFRYESIEKLLNISWRNSRFRSVTAAWRARLFELGIVVEAMAGQKFYVASTDQISAMTHGTLKFVGRKARKPRKRLVIAAGKVETDAQRAIVEHQARLMLGVENDAKKARMNLLPSTEIKAPPRIKDRTKA